MLVVVIPIVMVVTVKKQSKKMTPRAQPMALVSVTLDKSYTIVGKLAGTPELTIALRSNRFRQASEHACLTATYVVQPSTWWLTAIYVVPRSHLRRSSLPSKWWWAAIFVVPRSDLHGG